MKTKLLVLFILFMILDGCASTNLSPVDSSYRALEADEMRLWKRSTEEIELIDASGLLYEDSSITNYINQVAQKIQPAYIYKAIPFQVKVIKNPHLNAFAYPNGTIYVHTGILAQMDNEAQLATLLAHEMTHATHRHAVRGFRDVKNKAGFFSALYIGSGGLGLLGLFASTVGAIGTNASIYGYSRLLEAQADTVGLRLMANAGYNINEAPKLFVHLKKELTDENIKEPFLYASHPKLDERIQNYSSLINSKFQEIENGQNFESDFIRIMRPLLLDDAQLNLTAGRFGLAKKEIEKYLKLHSDHPNAYAMLGDVFRQQYGQDSLLTALNFYKKAASMDSTIADVHKNIGLINRKIKKTEEAEMAFRTYLRICSKCPDRKFIEQYLTTKEQ